MRTPFDLLCHVRRLHQVERVCTSFILRKRKAGYIIASPANRQTSTAHCHAAEAQGCSNASTCTGWLTNRMRCTSNPGCDCRCSRSCCCCDRGSDTCSILAVSGLPLPAATLSRLPSGCCRFIVTLAGNKSGCQNRKTTTAQGLSATASAAAARTACTQ